MDCCKVSSLTQHKEMIPCVDTLKTVPLFYPPTITKKQMKVTLSSAFTFLACHSERIEESRVLWLLLTAFLQEKCSHKNLCEHSLLLWSFSKSVNLFKPRQNRQRCRHLDRGFTLVYLV